ncbi:MAG TPA: hypothetical protein VGB26_05805 [Nitrospiria bacterium]|jgi:hypothetical protein
MNPGENIKVKGTKKQTPDSQEIIVVREFRGRLVKAIQINEQPAWKVELQNGRMIECLESDISPEKVVMVPWDQCRER